jgi:hypothetical protein
LRSEQSIAPGIQSKLSMLVATYLHAVLHLAQASVRLIDDKVYYQAEKQNKPQSETHKKKRQNKTKQKK